ncbi:hypothetical protein SUGI_1473100 [Cryptomeria japonica]|uniref:Uncharacterized protein n=1 Tax=Cryptomeria japonica TaxID=3369 RepID=A0AAD3NT81_CRYJA|nr:hypothetical protein SUGI_1473100 [Cryptomeria japonica]
MGQPLGRIFFVQVLGGAPKRGFSSGGRAGQNPWAAFFSSKCWAGLRRGVSHPGAELGKTLGPHFFCPSVGRGFEEGFLIQGPSWATLGPHFFRPSVGRGFEEGFLIRGLHFFCPSAGRGSEEGFLIQVPSSATHVPHFFRPSAGRGSEERKWKWGFGHYPRATFPSESLVRLFTVAAPHVRTGDFWVGASGAHYFFAQASSGVSGALRSGVIGAAPLFLSERLVGLRALVGTMVRTKERSEVCSKVRRARSRSPVCPGCAPRVHLRCGGHHGVHEVGARFAPGAHLACTFAGVGTSAGLRALVRTKERSEVCSKVRRARSRSPVCPGCAPRVHLGAVGTMACTKSEPGLPRVRTPRAPSPGWAPRLGCAPWCAPRSAPKCAPRCGVHEVGARFAPGAHLACTFAAVGTLAGLGTIERSEVCSKVRTMALQGAQHGVHEVGARFAPGSASKVRTSVCSEVRTRERSEVPTKSKVGLIALFSPGALRGAQHRCAPRRAPKCAPRCARFGARFARGAHTLAGLRTLCALQGAHEVGARFAPGAHLRQGAHLDAHALAGLRTLVGAMVRTFRALQGAHEVGARFAPGAHLGGRHGALRGAQDWCAPRSAPKCAPRKLLNGAHHWCAPKCAPRCAPLVCSKALSSCVHLPRPRTRPRPASLTCPGRLVRNLRVRNITVHLGQRARLDRARTGRGAHRFHLGARAAPRAHRGARTTPGLHRGLCARGASGARSVSPPRAR